MVTRAWKGPWKLKPAYENECLWKGFNSLKKGLLKTVEIKKNQEKKKLLEWLNIHIYIPL